jgi:IS30 family transposase
LRRGDLVLLEVDGLRIERPLQMVWLKGRSLSPSAQAFCDMYRLGLSGHGFATQAASFRVAETIYTAIYAQPRGELRRQLIACLRHGHSTRMSRKRGTDRRGQIPDMVSIHVRPPEVDDRVMPGHWEGDFIKGAGNQSSVGVLVERTSRLVLLAKMEDATAASALAGFTAKLNSIAAPLRKSFTYDQGKEMTRHQELSAATGVRVYFCDPHSPWQRGTCENTNGLLRQYLPKGTDLSIYSQDELDGIADSLNSRPRATHAFHSPFEVFERMLATASITSASIH